jgi:hypothetical protein
MQNCSNEKISSFLRLHMGEQKRLTTKENRAFLMELFYILIVVLVILLNICQIA